MIVMKCKIISEQTLLASIIIDNTRFAEAHAIIGPDYFSHDLHRIIYEVMLVLDANNDFIDYINLSEKLLSNGQIAAFSYLKNYYTWPVSEDIGGVARFIRRAEV